MPDQLPSLQNSTPTKQILTALTPGLKALLGVEPSNKTAVSEIAGNPVMLVEARGAVSALKDHATAAASPDDIKRIIGAKFATYRQPQRSEPEWDAFWADHYLALDGVSASALEAAMDSFLLDPDVEFLPKPAKIRERAMTTPNRAVRAYDRARQAIELSEEREKRIKNPVALPDFNLPRADKSPADKSLVQAQLREFMAADATRKAAERARRPQPNFHQAKTDETGITPEMREFLAQRDG